MSAEYLQRYELKLPADQTLEMRHFAQLYSSDI